MRAQQAAVFAHQRVRIAQQRGFSLFDQLVARLGLRRVQRAGHGVHIAPLIERVPRGDERARAVAARLDDHRRDRKAAEDAVAGVVMLAPRLGAGRVFADDRAREQDVAHQAAVLRRIAHIRPAGQHGDRQAARAQRAAVCGPVVAERHAADRDEPGARQRGADAFGGVQPVGRGLARADHRNAGHDVKIRPAAAHIQHDRRVLDRAQAVGVGAVAEREDADVLLRALLDDALRPCGVLVAQRVHLRLVQAAGRGDKRLAIGGEHRLGRTKGAQQLRRRARADPVSLGKPNITQMGRHIARLLYLVIS